MHGGEESGADASLQILYDLADRSDCAAASVLRSSNVVIMPTQNPDGREAETRRNANGFDMNRDWFARTQPETDGKIQVVRRYPPMLFIDAHEFGLSNYLFPPHADPEYHETPDTAHDWIFDLYGPAMEASFDREGVRYFHGPPYDFFATVFGDTVPAMGFHAAGMTFEKENGDPIADRTREQYLASWSSLYAGASEPGMVADWHASFVEAYREGVDGILEPNAVYNDGSVLPQPVPNERVRHYFLRADANRAIELHSLVRRLQRMDVDVYRAGCAALRGRLPRIWFGRRVVDNTSTEHLLDPDGTGAEALDPIDAARRDVDPHRHHVRRERLVEPAADEHPRWMVGSRARAGCLAHGTPRTCADPGAAELAAVGRVLRERPLDPWVRVRGAAAVALREPLAPAVHRRVGR